MRGHEFLLEVRHEHILVWMKHLRVCDNDPDRTHELALSDFGQLLFSGLNELFHDICDAGWAKCDDSNISHLVANCYHVPCGVDWRIDQVQWNTLQCCADQDLRVRN